MQWQELLHTWIIMNLGLYTTQFFRDNLVTLLYGHFILSVQMVSLINFRIGYNDYNSSFSELLEVANENTIGIRNLKFIVSEISKF